MNRSSRRSFLQSMMAASLGGALPTRRLHALDLRALSAMPHLSALRTSSASDKDLRIFPEPREIAASGSDFLFDDKATIVVPPGASAQDAELARSLREEVSDRFGRQLRIECRAHVGTEERVIVMGTRENALAAERARSSRENFSASLSGPESYLLRVDRDQVNLVGSDDRGAFYGLQSLRQLLFRDGETVGIRGVRVHDWPDKPFRGIYLYLPGRANIPFFKRFVSDFAALYKFNTLIVEMNANMRLERHPELNQGWRDLVRDTNYSFRNYPSGPFHDVEQNSSHQDSADGDILEKEEVAELAAWMAKHHIELVPELASFTHSYHLLAAHKDLAAVPENKWPDIYCAANPRSYQLVFEVYDEFIDLLKPKMVHIGHDELFLPVGASPQCKDTDIGELYGQDVKKIHDHLAARGIRTALWGDMLLEPVRGRGLQKKRTRDGWQYQTPGGLTREQVERLIPKDCLIFNWFWSEEREEGGGTGEANEELLDTMGFTQVYGNFEPTIQNYATRKKRKTLIGGAPSAWFATNEFGFGKEMMSTFLGCSSILWTGEVSGSRELSGTVQAMMSEVRMRLSGSTPPSLTETAMTPLDLSQLLNSSGKIADLDVDLSQMQRGHINLGNVLFDLNALGDLQAIVVGANGKTGSGLPTTSPGIPVGDSPLSVVFLHASAKKAANRESFRELWDQQDTADMLGWYEMVYEDGFVTTVPIRYGGHLLEWNWNERTSANDYCYGADAVPVGAGSADGVTLFAWEWINPRFGKVIREIRLHGTQGFRSASAEFDNHQGAVIENNAVILRAITLVKKRG